MTENKYMFWLNWECFEVAVINQLFTSDITVDKLGEYAKQFSSDIFKKISLNEFIDSVNGIFKLSNDQLSCIYETLVTYTVSDPQEAIFYSTVSNSDDINNLKRVSAIDMCCYLFAFLIKKKHSTFAEVAQIEQFPGAKNVIQHIPKTNRVFSLSTPTVSAKMTNIQPIVKKESSHYILLLRFFLLKLPIFLKQIAPNGLTSRHLDSLTLLINGGPSWNKKFLSLSHIFTDPVVENEKFIAQISSVMFPHDTIVEMSSKVDAPISSPLHYRPLMFQREKSTLHAKPLDDKDLIPDIPLSLSRLSKSFQFEEPQNIPSTHISECKGEKINICGVVSTCYISRCSDCHIFIGACCKTVHMDDCANCSLVCASSIVHLDSCSQCKLYLLVKNRPIFTGNCIKLSIAPYNALYMKFLANTLMAGLNTNVNLWRKPITFGLIGTRYQVLKPEDFNLYVLPFFWSESYFLVSPPLPAEYQASLEEKKQKFLKMKEDLKIIKEKDNDLYEKIVESIKKTSSKWVNDTGRMNEVVQFKTLVK